jgi:hypothetical protein
VEQILVYHHSPSYMQMTLDFAGQKQFGTSPAVHPNNAGRALDRALGTKATPKNQKWETKCQKLVAARRDESDEEKTPSDHC